MNPLLIELCPFSHYWLEIQILVMQFFSNSQQQTILNKNKVYFSWDYKVFIIATCSILTLT